MEVKDSYRTIDVANTYNQKIKKSTFISQAYPLGSQLAVSNILEKVKKKYYDARHHPYAFRTGLEDINYRSSDDGEPAGSAGKPILEAIEKYDLTNVLVIVSRYFGGVKLGVGGLRRAFFSSAEECIKSAKVITKYIYEDIKLEFDYEFVNNVMRLLEKEEIKISNNVSDERVKLCCSVRLCKIEKVKTNLLNITKGNIKILSIKNNNIKSSND